MLLLMKMLIARFPFHAGAMSNSLGVTLIETVVALAIFASAGTAVLLGVSTAHRSSAVVDASAVAEHLARNQMEFVWTQTYIDAPAVAPWETYTTIDAGLIPDGFGVIAEAQYYADDGLDGSIEKVVVTVTRNGESYHVLETLRTGP